MGCDIHMVLEKLDNESAKWVGLHAFPRLDSRAFNFYSKDSGDVGLYGMHMKATSRSYQLFGELAGVRGESSQGNEPKGLPQDASDLTHMMDDHWGLDGHSHSHLSLLQFITCWEIVNGDVTKIVEHKLQPTNESYKYILSKASEITGLYVEPEDLDNYRICFWFDN